MITTLKAYSVHISYWLIILTTVLIFGTLMGTTGVARLKTMHRLTLIDVNTKDRLQIMVEKNDTKIINLDSRITVIEKTLNHQSK
jgi:hypothetical protein